MTSWVVGGLNTSKAVTVEAAGRTFQLRQAHESGLCGTSLWDSSFVFVRHLDAEAGSSTGALSRDRLSISRVVELGAGCGLSGMACAAYGADVTFTDKADVMAHLEANVTNNFKGDEAVLERLQFIPFSWGTDPVAAGLSPPYSIVLATDVVYMRSQINPLIDALLSLSDSKSTIVVAIERRDEALWADFQHALKAACRVRRVPVRRMASRIDDEDEAEDEEGESQSGAAESLGIFVCHKRNRPPPPRDAAESEQAAVEPPGQQAAVVDQFKVT